MRRYDEYLPCLHFKCLLEGSGTDRPPGRSNLGSMPMHTQATISVKRLSSSSSNGGHKAHPLFPCPALSIPTLKRARLWAASNRHCPKSGEPRAENLPDGPDHRWSSIKGPLSADTLPCPGIGQTSRLSMDGNLITSNPFWRGRRATALLRCRAIAHRASHRETLKKSRATAIPGTGHWASTHEDTDRNRHIC